MDSKLMPREKLQKKGAASLSDAELLQALIGSGYKGHSAKDIAKDLLKLVQDKGADITYDNVAAINGMGSAKSTEIIAAFELAKRYLIKSEQPIINSTDAAVEQLKDICNKTQEYFVLLTLDGANRLINLRTVTIGTLNSSLVHPREVFAPALEDRAASIIVAHNHPSGSLEPSQEDIEVTKRLKEVGEIVGIPLVDHIIVTKSEFRSVMV
jgi:DNA repair protein RadC